MGLLPFDSEGRHGVRIMVAVAVAVLSCCCQVSAADSDLNPLVMFPAYAFSKLQVTVHPSFSAPDIPGCSVQSKTSFDVFYRYNPANTGFSEECIYRMLEPVFDFPGKPNQSLEKRFSEQKGVTVSLLDFGDHSCLSEVNGVTEYDPLIETLESHGLIRDSTLRFACYDFRASPTVDLIKPHRLVEQTQKLVETTYRAAGNRPVFLLGHSNGPLVAQHFLNAMSAEWKETYIQGFIALAGNWAGQGLLYSTLLSGLSIAPEFFDFKPTLARSMATFPSTYLSSSQPEVFSGPNDIVIIDTTAAPTGGRTYRVSEAKALLADAGYGPKEAELMDLFRGAVNPSQWPGVSVYEFYGTGLPTVVATKYDVPASIGIAPIDFITLPGDGNQEAIDNEANQDLWLAKANQGTSCVFTVTQLGGVTHFQYKDNPTVLSEVVEIMTFSASRSRCIPGN